MNAYVKQEIDIKKLTTSGRYDKAINDEHKQILAWDVA